MWWDTIVLGAGVRAATMRAVSGLRDGLDEAAKGAVRVALFGHDVEVPC
ncbi:hypothetical protein QFZ82_006893 [Streptomyces sp. V4I23]|nr:hypothetical protein [Streptomyces sp. V4I23]